MTFLDAKVQLSQKNPPRIEFKLIAIEAMFIFGLTAVLVTLFGA